MDRGEGIKMYAKRRNFFGIASFIIVSKLSGGAAFICSNVNMI